MIEGRVCPCSGAAAQAVALFLMVVLPPAMVVRFSLLSHSYPYLLTLHALQRVHPCIIILTRDVNQNLQSILDMTPGFALAYSKSDADGTRYFTSLRRQMQHLVDDELAEYH